ncbi:MAG: hypothetical protein LZF86_110169 [Nitrospira sp.]|nr:MAG: hypothetical protein LZF86_110169 [Nitrospira sp.]
MSEQVPETDALQVRLRSSEQVGQPKFANYSYVGVSHAMAYLDFGFIEPAHLAQVARRLAEGSGAGKSFVGMTVTRVAMGLPDLMRLHQQVMGVIKALTTQAPPKFSKSSINTLNAD